MKKYTFLLKPVFFIFSLLFATWLVIKIEKISPSDFDENTPNCIIESNSSLNFPDRKKYLQNVCTAYKMGVIDSVVLNKKLTFFLESTKNTSSK